MKLPSLLNLEEEQARPLSKWRNIIAFWIIGLTNNYPYVIMLSAAYDIVQHLPKPPQDGHNGDLHHEEWTALPSISSNSSSQNSCAANGNYSSLCGKSGTSVGADNCTVTATLRYRAPLGGGRGTLYSIIKVLRGINCEIELSLDSLIRIL